MKGPHAARTFHAEISGIRRRLPDDNAAEVAEYADELSVENRLEEEIRDVEKALTAPKTVPMAPANTATSRSTRSASRPALPPSSCINCKKILTPGNVATWK